MLLSDAIAEFYGVKDEEKRADLVRYLNGMLAFADSRKPTVELFFGGVAFAVDEIRQLREKNAATTKEMQRISEEYKRDFAESTKLVERAGKASQELQAKNAALTKSVAQFSLSNTALERQHKLMEAELVKERADVEKLKAANASLTDEVRKLKAIPPGVASPASPAEVKQFVAEYERLQSALSAMTAAVSLDPAPQGTEKQRNAPMREYLKLRDDFMKQGAKLEALGKEMAEQAKADAEKILSLQRQVDELGAKRVDEAERPAKRARESPPAVGPVEATLVADAPKRRARVALLPTFMSSATEPMICPVPTRGGYVIPLHDVYERWKVMGIDFMGTQFATFQCPHTGEHTMLAPPQIIQMLFQIATELELCVQVPERVMYVDQGAVTDFPIVDQIIIMSACCNLYRLQVDYKTVYYNY